MLAHRACGSYTPVFPHGTTCRHQDSGRANKHAKREMQWFLQAMLLQELGDDDAAKENGLQMPVHVFAKAVQDTESCNSFPAHLKWAIECCIYHGVALPPAGQQDGAAARQQLSESLLSVSGFCDEVCAKRIFSLLQEQSGSVTEFAGTLGSMLSVSDAFDEEGTEEGEPDAEGMRRRVLACRQLQRSSLHPVDDALGGKLADVLRSSLAHSDPRCRLMGYDALAAAAFNTSSAAVAQRCIRRLGRAARCDAPCRSFLLSAVWDILHIWPELSTIDIGVHDEDSSGGGGGGGGQQQCDAQVKILDDLLSHLTSHDDDLSVVTAIQAGKLLLLHEGLMTAAPQGISDEDHPAASAAAAAAALPHRSQHSSHEEDVEYVEPVLVKLIEALVTLEQLASKPSLHSLAQGSRRECDIDHDDAVHRRCNSTVDDDDDDGR
jgi:hypothetical protein